MSRNEEMLHTMIDCGILETLVEIFSSDDSDSETLVCINYEAVLFTVFIGDKYTTGVCNWRTFTIDSES